MTSKPKRETNKRISISLEAYELLDRIKTECSLKSHAQALEKLTALWMETEKINPFQALELPAEDQEISLYSAPFTVVFPPISKERSREPVTTTGEG